MAYARSGYYTQPEREVVKVFGLKRGLKLGRAKLSCGHTIVRRRTPKVGARVVCWSCAKRG